MAATSSNFVNFVYLCNDPLLPSGNNDAISARLKQCLQKGPLVHLPQGSSFHGDL